MKSVLLASLLFVAGTTQAFSFCNSAASGVDYRADSAIRLTVAGTYASGIFNEGGAEIGAYDPATRQLFVTNANTNTLDVLDIRNIHHPRLRKTIDLSTYGAGVNSVAVKNGMVAVAVEADPKQSPGTVVFFDAGAGFSIG